jgi:hypothetical protein
MSYQDHTYIIFDADNDKWAYDFMRGWKSRDHIDFDFDDAHDFLTLTWRAQSEDYIKGKLWERMKRSKQVIVIIGESTRYLYKYVRWEVECALELGLPIIAVNLNGMREQDNGLCPPIIRDKNVIHIPFKLAAIRFALNDFPDFYYKTTMRGPYYYRASVYRDLGL